MAGLVLMHFAKALRHPSLNCGEDKVPMVTRPCVHEVENLQVWWSERPWVSPSCLLVASELFFWDCFPRRSKWVANSPSRYRHYFWKRYARMLKNGWPILLTVPCSFKCTIEESIPFAGPRNVNCYPKNLFACSDFFQIRILQS